MTERDEFAYHEILGHLPLFSHPNPRNVLIVGGGDGGVLREVCRHSYVEHITIIEIDPAVIAVSKRFFADSIGKCFDDERLEIIYQDAAEFMKMADENAYDVIIADTSDPQGPAQSLFQPAFYESMYKSLRHDGIVCAQGECMWIHLDLISEVLACCADIFEHAEYATTMVPTYPCGQIGFVLARKGRSESCRIPRRRPTFLADLRWYNPAIHRASFVLPQFVRRRLDAALGIDGTVNDLNGHDASFGAYDPDGDDADASDCFLTRCTIS